MKVGEKGIIKIGDGFAVRCWDPDHFPEKWDVLTPERSDYETNVNITPATQWDHGLSKIRPVPGHVDVEFEHNDCYNSTTTTTHQVSLEMLAEVLRRSEYTVEKP